MFYLNFNSIEDEANKLVDSNTNNLHRSRYYFIFIFRFPFLWGFGVLGFWGFGEENGAKIDPRRHRKSEHPTTNLKQIRNCKHGTLFSPQNPKTPKPQNPMRMNYYNQK